MAITTSNQAKRTLPSVPRRPNQLPPPRRKTNRPLTHPSTCSARRRGPWAAARLHCRPRRKAPLLRARRSLPGDFAYLAAAPSASEAARAGWGSGGARWESRRPSAASRAPIAALLPRGGAEGVSSRGLSAAAWEPRVRFSFTTTSPRHRNPTGGRSRRGGRAGRDGSAAAAGHGGEPARGTLAGPGQRGCTYLCHNCGDVGLRNRFFQKQTENGLDVKEYSVSLKLMKTSGIQIPLEVILRKNFQIHLK
ncbi:uncharacterized protein LOC129042753 [Pongo pygmaeus]|uniref:uncharacterized protein LOC129042753 n=1 Tax=Pongo pygmaeus TaxID=9600 RepID=UPI00300D4B5C